MKSIILTFLLLVIVVALPKVFGQTLYTPGGTVGNNTTNSNVGIGTSSPAALVDINQNGGASGQNIALKLRAGNTASYYGNSQLSFSYAGGVNYSHSIKTRHNSAGVSGNAFDFYLWKPGDAANAEGSQFVMTLNGGQVGIGTTTPYTKLDINGPGDGSLIINGTNKLIDSDLQDMISVRSENKTSTLNLVSNRSDAGLLGGLVFTTARGWSDSHRNIAGIVGGRTGTEGYAGGYLAFWTKNNNGDIPREYMRISHEGKVGIGTTSPSAKLHVFGTGGNLDYGNNNPLSGDFIIQSNTKSTTSGAQLEFVIPANSDGTNIWGQGRIITVAGSTTSGHAVGKMILGTRRYFDKYQTGIQWYYGDDLTIDGSGNIGVGTISPDSKLTVKGDIHTREVKVDLNGAVGPDYVFEKDYDLISLSELETYINQNKHLPEVPSAKEMESSGLNLKEMNLLLLKKVEELTLHLIEKEKQMEKMEKRIEQLENKN